MLREKWVVRSRDRAPLGAIETCFCRECETPSLRDCRSFPMSPWSLVHLQRPSGVVRAFDSLLVSANMGPTVGASHRHFPVFVLSCAHQLHGCGISYRCVSFVNRSVSF